LRSICRAPRALPPTSAAYKRTVEKFDTQETELERLQGQVRKLQEAQKARQKEFEDYVASAEW
jgi:hypothetical protein